LTALFVRHKLRVRRKFAAIPQPQSSNLTPGGITLKKLPLQLLVAASIAFFAGNVLAQRADKLSQNLEAVLASAQIDFREYRKNPAAVPSLSTDLTSVTCQMNTWANNVPMYVCYGQFPLAGGDTWFRATLETFKRLQPGWPVKMNASNDDRHADAGPENCEPTPNEGPYLGQCPMHMQMVKQPDGTTKLYLWINSLSSPYLMHHAAAPQKIAARASNASGCDEFCESFQKVFAARTDSFAALRAATFGDGADSSTSLRFPGAKKCTFSTAARQPAVDSGAKDLGTRFVCYWTESSSTAAENRFRALVSKVQPLLPSDWPAQEHMDPDNATGNPIRTWSAAEPGTAVHDVRLFLSGNAVSLQINVWAPFTESPK
jgi:hypothetical protein